MIDDSLKPGIAPGPPWCSHPVMTPAELRERTMRFALRILKLPEQLPTSACGQAVAKQISRSGTSVADNYRAALRGKSKRDFVHKITTVREEVDETAFWLELLERSAVLPARRLESLLNEAEELTRIFAATRQSARDHR